MEGREKLKRSRKRGWWGVFIIPLPGSGIHGVVSVASQLCQQMTCPVHERRAGSGRGLWNPGSGCG